MIFCISVEEKMNIRSMSVIECYGEISPRMGIEPICLKNKSSALPFQLIVLICFWILPNCTWKQDETEFHWEFELHWMSFDKWFDKWLNTFSQCTISNNLTLVTYVFKFSSASSHTALSVLWFVLLRNHIQTD